MTDQAKRVRKTIVKTDKTLPSLKVVDGAVVEIPPEEKDIIVDDEVEENEEILHRILTDKGEAVYKYFGDCEDCTREKEVTPVFVCVSDPIRADEMMGNQLAAFWNEGGGHGAPLCMRHYNIRLGNVPKKSEVEYKVLYRSLD